MLSLVFPKSQLGPIIDTTVAPSPAGANHLKTAGLQLPLPRQLKMLVDSGAETTVIDEDIATSFSLPYVGAAWARTMNGVRPARKYELTLTLFGSNSVSWTSPPVHVMARRDAFVGAPYAGLIGRDVLDLGLFILNGPAHHCTLSF